MATSQVVKHGVRRLMETEASIADNLIRRPFKKTDLKKASITLLGKFRDGPLEIFFFFLGGGGNFRAAGIFLRYKITCVNFF